MASGSKKPEPARSGKGGGKTIPMAAGTAKALERIVSPDVEFVIEKDVPPPVASKQASSRYPWDKMEPGDSFKVAASSAENAAKIKASIMQSGRLWCKSHRLDAAGAATCKVRVQATFDSVRAWLVSK